ncbi:MAG TPA: M48 family metallopeptidase, partial [Thermoanaerobaculia bacterium]|nr:M48 family metallopeptidase [Thermoanaerobaculia bacterium]
MSLTFEERVAVVDRLSAAASESPRRYRMRVVAWIILGYAIVGTLLALSLLLTLGVVALLVMTRTAFLISVLWVPVMFGYTIARSLFVRIDPPSGRVLRRHEAPRLFAIVDEIRERVRVPRLDGVLITADMNAAVVETPRFGGLFGWRRHLIIGLPLMITHSAEEMKAVLAHELGHLSAQHGRVMAWSWRVRMTWGMVLASIDARRGTTARMLQKLMHWYGEHLMLTTLVLARRQELAADETSAELTSRETAARSLAWLAVATALIDRNYWTPLWERVASEPQPPANPFHDLLRRRAEVLAPPFDAALATELERRTALDDTHPALAARLEQLGIVSPAIALAPRCAAEELLGRTAAAVIAETDREWRAVVGPQWQERHQALGAARQQVDNAEGSLHDKAEALV